MTYAWSLSKIHTYFYLAHSEKNEERKAFVIYFHHVQTFYRIYDERNGDSQRFYPLKCQLTTKTIFQEKQKGLNRNRGMFLEDFRIFL